MDAAAAYLRYDGPRAAEKAIHFLKRAGVKLQRRGRTYLVRQAAIDRALEGTPSELALAAEIIAHSDRSRPRGRRSRR